MPKRRLTFRACAYGVMLACFTQVQADESAWNGSYAANGSCYCTGGQSRNIDSRIVPTPVGGQSISQVCERVGEGPALRKTDGKFNFTVYPDAQCGNGPFTESTSVSDEQCVGNLGVAGEDCTGRGPRWDLKFAYSKQAKPAEANSENSIVTGGSRYINPPVQKLASSSVSLETKPQGNATAVKKSRTQQVAKKAKRATRVKKTPTRRLALPETREQIRARQLEHLAAARKRANLNNPITSIESVGEPLRESAEQLTPEISTEASVDSVVSSTVTPSVTPSSPTTVAAVKVPAVLHSSELDFNYVEAAPVTYDYGGAGMSVMASKSSHNRLQYIFNAALAETYREAAVGLGLFITPPQAPRVTLMFRTGVEYGVFEFQNGDIEADWSDSGVFAGMASRFAVSRQFKLQAGVSFSSFFERDAVASGAAFYHLTPQLDLTAKAEAGDNDLIGFGIRYHY